MKYYFLKGSLMLFFSPHFFNDRLKEGKSVHLDIFSEVSRED